MQIDFDVDDLIKQAESWGAAADQLPYALSRSLNAAMDDARRHLIEHTWPEHVTVRNTQFIRRVLHIQYSDKFNLEASIYEDKTAVQGDAHLKLHDTGGTKTAKGMFTIPTQNVSLTSFGPRADQKPGHFEGVIIGHTLYRRFKRGHHSTLVPMYRLAHTVNQPADVPFSADFAKAVSDAMQIYFPSYVAQAMATRRR